MVRQFKEVVTQIQFRQGLGNLGKYARNVQETVTKVNITEMAPSLAAGATTLIAFAIRKYLQEIKLPEETLDHVRLWARENPTLFVFVCTCVLGGVAAQIIVAAVRSIEGDDTADSLTPFIHALITSTSAGIAVSTLQKLGVTSLLGPLGVGAIVTVPVLIALYKRLDEAGWTKDLVKWVANQWAVDRRPRKVAQRPRTRPRTEDRLSSKL